MKHLFSSIELFQEQIFIGSLLGLFLSTIGIFLLLKNMAFMGITISQVLTAILAIFLFFQIEGDYFSLVGSIGFIFPMLYYITKVDEKKDTILGILFVSSTSISQLLLATGGNVQNHILHNFFGDILTSSIGFFSFGGVLVVCSYLVFILLYRRIQMFFFDSEEYIASGRTRSIELIFLVIVSCILTVSVKLFGSFYSSAQLIIPGFISLMFFSSMRSVFLFAGLISITATILGFGISLIEFKFGNGTFFPTSSVIVTILAIFSFCSIIIRRLFYLK
ncbi:MAG: metal ABC transporter permease [Leptospiraceae bacterium]|nr:metal ABC transporter permease [Leptospiraceae bacterium]